MKTTKDEFIDFMFSRWWEQLSSDYKNYHPSMSVARKAFKEGYRYGKQEAALDELASLGQEWEKVGGTD